MQNANAKWTTCVSTSPFLPYHLSLTPMPSSMKTKETAKSNSSEMGPEKLHFLIHSLLNQEGSKIC